RRMPLLRRRKTPWLPLGVGLSAALVGALVYLKYGRKVAPPLPALANSVGMEFVEVPAGKFLMGSPADEKGRDDDEEQHEVESTRPSSRGTSEVARGRSRAVMGAAPSVAARAGVGDTSSSPAENVSWGEAVAFCRRLSELPEEKEAGRSYRLP